MAATSTRTPPPALEDIAAATLTGDLRDFLLGWVRNMPKPWPQMSEREQTSFIDATERQCEALVGRATKLVGSQGFTSLEISVGDFQKKGTRLEAKVTAPYSRDTLVDLAEAGEAGPIVLSLVSMQHFRGERAPARAMKDQPDLMDAEAEEGAESPKTAETAPDSDAIEAGDDRAAGLQAEVLADDGDPATSPEARRNGELLSEGIAPLDDARAGEGEADAIEAGGQTAGDAVPGRTKRPRRTAEQRVADNATAAAQEPPAKRARRRADAVAL